MALLLSLFLVFAQLSLMAVGGANALVPEIHRVVVGELHWISAAEFAALYAIAQAAPGPNVLVVALIGWQVAGVPGALAAMLGICGPSSLLTFYVARWWQRFHGSPWLRAIERGFAPLSIGLVLGGGWLLAGIANTGHGAWLLCIAVTLTAWRWRIHPLWLLAAGAVAGGLGWV